MGAVLLFFFMLLLIAMLAVLTAGSDLSSPIFAVWLVFMTSFVFIACVMGWSERQTGGHSEARTLVSVAVTPSTVIFTDNNDNDNDNDTVNGYQGGSEGKNSASIPCYATSTTASTATTAAFGTTTRPSIKRGLINFFRGRSSSDRDYAALHTDISVHDSHDVVTGVPISAQQKL
jgi:hypothetical protein